MSQHHPTETQLNDFVDGLLPAGERDGVETHMAGCLRCRAEAESLRTLLADAAALPDSIEPPRDLWGGIATRIEERRVVPLRRERRADAHTLWQARWWLAAAAVVLVAGSSLLTMAALDRGAPAAASFAQASADQPIRLAANHVEQEYRVAIGQLTATLDMRRGQLAPETAAVIEKNLLIIDQAIADVQAALAADPSSRELVGALAASYQSKVELLQRAVRLPTQS